ncbi:bile acid:sodium symporter family protein [Haoranjiania flava]|uniref:Bile acid:sodium symporter n=1 Tax=Haoranjiania flava TaxID=1856322 RepID=A0AAE3LJW9_9BACT|nr:bile acid:sodium symporter family protein [Haoranjiania flava]MCU7693794.1 bile acid:sodium symporter [Haoranjiania flava]
MKYVKDPFLLSLIAVVILAFNFPVRGSAAVFFDYLSYFVVALLFFVHGALLSRQSVIAGITHWRLHLFIFSCTFVLFPLLTFTLRPLFATQFPTEIIAGLIYLSLLPSTVQSSIAFTSIAKGNVPAAVCSASVSNLIGVFLTPVLVGVLMKNNASGAAAGGLETIRDTVLQIFVPFVAGHLLHNKIGGWLGQRRLFTKAVDNGTILLVVFIAFSESVVSNTWGNISTIMLLKLILVCSLLLALVMVIIYSVATAMKFNREDKIAILFCGSKKTLANGLPMARIIFSGIPIAGLILPLMIFHQVQLMVCSFLAQRFRRNLVKQQVQ